MVALLDNLGIWNNLGSVFPAGDWQDFPLQATQGLSIFRATWGGDLSDIKSRVMLRPIYIRPGFAEPDSRWRRLYPKPGSEILFLNLPEELQSQGIIRGFQCVKWYKYLKMGVNIDSRYSLNLQEFQPFPNKEKSFKTLTASNLEEILVEVLERVLESE